MAARENRFRAPQPLAGKAWPAIKRLRGRANAQTYQSLQLLSRAPCSHASIPPGSTSSQEGEIQKSRRRLQFSTRCASFSASSAAGLEAKATLCCQGCHTSPGERRRGLMEGGDLSPRL